MKFCKKIISEFICRFQRAIGNIRAEMEVGGLPPFKITEVVIKGTTYIVSSFSKKDAKGDVIDKVARLIERDAANLTGK